MTVGIHPAREYRRRRDVSHSLLTHCVKLNALNKKAAVPEGLKSAFGAAVRSRRHRLDISQEDLAWRAGLHRTYVTNVERGVCNVSLETISKLANALETTLASLIVDAEHVIGRRHDVPVDILLVEDRPDDAALACRALKAAGVANTIRIVHDGEEALEYVFCSGRYSDKYPENHPRLILLDLNLPKVGGLEVLKRLKADKRTRPIPVVVLTVSRRDRDVAESRRLGADAYVVKPVDFDGLRDVIPKLDLCWLIFQRPVQQAAGA